MDATLRLIARHPAPKPPAPRPVGTACAVCSFPCQGDHEPWCPHFLRGPDPGGDPYEWPTLFPAPAEEDPRP